MKQLFSITALLCGLAGVGLAHAESDETVSVEEQAEAAQEALTTADTIAIRDVVRAQLNAFAADDAAAAFELATMEKQLLIGSPDIFLQLIRERYEPIYRNKILIFDDPEVVHGLTVQRVRVTDSYSRVWVAIFWMQQDEQANWKIDGCHLVETTNISV